MKKILVPTDLSDIAELGLTLAIEIAHRCKASISLINFTRHPPGKTFNYSGELNSEPNEEENIFTLELLQDTKEKLKALASKYAGYGIAIDYAVIDDKFKSGLDAYMSREDIDFIVMGTSGEETVKEAFTGNHAQQVIKMSSCPVLSVRDGFSIEDFSNIVVAVTVISDNRVAEGLGELAEIATCFDAHVHLVHVRDRARDSNLILDEYFQRMAAIAGLKKFSVTILDSEDVSEAIVRYAENVKAGFIAVLKNSPEGIFRIFANRFSDRIIREEGRPVFTLNLQNSD